MSKQVLTSELAERPGGIGNYKGVMLCNRPGEAPPRASRDGPVPFVSRVTVKDSIGLNPTAWLPPHHKRKNKRQLDALAKHKFYLQSLQEKKEQMYSETLKLKETKEQQRRVFVEKLAKKRSKIRGTDEPRPQSEQTKRTEDLTKGTEDVAKPAKLTEKNLKGLAEREDRKSRASNKQKPQWALTEEQKAKEEELEVDELLNFVNELDYDKYIEDLEIRQALAIIKERVDEIKRDDEWKQNIVKLYNQKDDKPKSEAGRDEEAKSEGGKSEASVKSFVSKARSQIEEERKQAEERTGGWDKSTKSDAVSITAEERVAKLVADQVLQSQPVSDKQRLKGIHSNLSIRKLLEREAVKQLTSVKGPVVSVIQEKARKVEDASNLPYLHRNPAV